jgi:hypothetical protein
MSQPSHSSNLPWYGWVVLILLSPLLIALGLIILVAHFTARMALYALVWILWCSRGRNVLYVYSDSPIWKDHIESEVIPRCSDRVVILNWSRRKRWRVSLATLLFHHFGGSKEFNPIAIVFRPFRKRIEFRFWRPFHEWRKGNTQNLKAMERSFLELLTRMGQNREGEQGVAPNA